MIITILVLIIIIILGAGFFIFMRLNNYMEKIENKISETLVIQENIKQSFKNALVDSSFLLDDGKLKKSYMEETKVNIYNGNNLKDEEVEF